MRGRRGTTMRWREGAGQGRRTVVVICDAGEDPVASITQAAEAAPGLTKRIDPRTGLALIDI